MSAPTYLQRAQENVDACNRILAQAGRPPLSQDDEMAVGMMVYRIMQAEVKARKAKGGAA